MTEERYNECAARWVREYGMVRARVLADILAKSGGNARRYYWQVGMALTMHATDVLASEVIFPSTAALN